MFGIFVNDRTQMFSIYLANGMKPFETRTKRTLDRYVGQTVAIVRTGKSKPVVVGYMRLGDPFLSDHEFDRRKAMIYGVPEYDCKPGQKKWFYPVISCQTCVPYSVPDDAVRHGRISVELPDVKEYN